MTDESQAAKRTSVMHDIEQMGHLEEMTHDATVIEPSAKAKRPSSAKAAKAGMLGFSTGDDGTIKEEWDPYLPRPPSLRKIEEPDNSDAEQVAVFNANTHEGFTMVKVLAEKGLRVVAAVRVFTSRNAKLLLKIKGVTVKVADLNDEESLMKVAEGCTRAFVVTKYWEKFDHGLEEQMTTNVLRSCAKVQPSIHTLVLATFEDTKELIAKGQKSQLVPTADGRIFPRFEGMATIAQLAKDWNIQITHMMTSYMDEEDQKKSLILLRGPNGRLVVNEYIQKGGDQKSYR
jgi:hypothetical protein